MYVYGILCLSTWDKQSHAKHICSEVRPMVFLPGKWEQETGCFLGVYVSDNFKHPIKLNWALF